MEIQNPRRILLLAPPDSGVEDLLRDFTGSTPTAVPISNADSTPAAEPVVKDPHPTTSSSNPTSPQTPIRTTTLAGTTHLHTITTPYYTATVPIWIDEIPLYHPPSSSSPSSNPPTSPSPAHDWATSFLAPEAREVLSALGAFIVAFPKPVTGEDYVATKTLLREVGRVVQEGCGDAWDGVLVAVGMRAVGLGTGSGSDGGDGDGVGEEEGERAKAAPSISSRGSILPRLVISNDEWEQVCFDEGGWEFIDAEQGRGLKGLRGKKREVERNEFGETTGLPRLLEALEANDWTSPLTDLETEELKDELGLSSHPPTTHDADEDEEDDEWDMQNPAFSFQSRELEEEMRGLRGDIYSGSRAGLPADEGGEEEEAGVEQLEGLMLRMQGLRDMSADMPDAERKRFAAKAVRDIMREL